MFVRKTGSTLALYEQRYPEDFRISLRKGQICRLRGDVECAESSLRQAIEESPELALAHFELSQVLLQADRLEDAQEALAGAVSRDPDNGGYLLELAQLHLSLGEPEEAISLLEKVEFETCSRLPTGVYGVPTSPKPKAQAGQRPKITYEWGNHGEA